ncbi:LOG family protein [Colletotrichum chlorophyti]|uniref:LOG family protein n=1 Tax=Colletotrichum chlorophyti TaxID=708187 RepID=A0A1Q8RKW5_9PEZI|nr:LOG family protein [Colletotrichum chlorophyti]
MSGDTSPLQSTPATRNDISSTDTFNGATNGIANGTTNGITDGHVNGATIANGTISTNGTAPADSPVPTNGISLDNGTAAANDTALSNGTTNSSTTNSNGTNGIANGVRRRTKICVYCGASPGFKPQHMEAARELARIMAENNIDLVYGGGTVGLMGEVAKTLVSLAGPDSVHGIIPEALVKYERDGTYGTLNKDNMYVPEETVYGRTTVVKDMHTRKQMMAKEVFAGGPGSGFIALPGGYGTIEEVLETATWNQLGIHNRGICLLNINGFYDGILEWVNKSVDEGFIRAANANILVTATTSDEAIRALRNYKVSEATFKLDWSNS